MPLSLSVPLLVLGGIVLAGIAGYLIEKSPEATEHLEKPPGQIKEHSKTP